MPRWLRATTVDCGDDDDGGDGFGCHFWRVMTVMTIMESAYKVDMENKEGDNEDPHDLDFDDNYMDNWAFMQIIYYESSILLVFL